MRRLCHLTGQPGAPTLTGLLGRLLASSASANNAGGFLVIRTYTSPMTGFIADLGLELGLSFLPLYAGLLRALRRNAQAIDQAY
jgi:hypothetical protein